MSTKSPHVFLTALVLIAAPSFAQETTPPAANTEMDAAATKAKETVDAAADAAEKTVTDAVKEPEKTMPANETAETKAAETEAGSTGAGTSGTTPETPAETLTAPATPAETTSPATPAEPAKPAPTPPANEGPQIGQPYAYAEHSAWTINCVKLDQGADPCVMTQLLKDSTDNPVAEMSFVSLNSQNVAAGGTLVTPLETDLIRGVGIRIDGGETRGYPFSVCTVQDGCIARIGFTEQELQQFKRGANAVITVLPYGADPANPINLTMSLSGFTAGFDELSRLNEASAETPEQPSK